MIRYESNCKNNILLEGVKTMVGKIVQLIGSKVDSSFKVIYGIEDYSIANRYLLSFGEILLGNTATNATTTYIYGGHLVKEQADGYKQVIIFNEELPKDAIEEYLLLVIPYASQLVTKTKRVAGRYYYEGIFEMKEGDIVEVSKDFAGKRQIYMVVKAGNELFLIKKNR